MNGMEVQWRAHKDFGVIRVNGVKDVKYVITGDFCAMLALGRPRKVTASWQIAGYCARDERALRLPINGLAVGWIGREQQGAHQVSRVLTKRGHLPGTGATRPPAMGHKTSSPVVRRPVGSLPRIPILHGCRSHGGSMTQVWKRWVSEKHEMRFLDDFFAEPRKPVSGTITKHANGPRAESGERRAESGGRCDRPASWHGFLNRRWTQMDKFEQRRDEGTKRRELIPEKAVETAKNTNHAKLGQGI